MRVNVLLLISGWLISLALISTWGLLSLSEHKAQGLMNEYSNASICRVTGNQYSLTRTGMCYIPYWTADAGAPAAIYVTDRELCCDTVEECTSLRAYFDARMTEQRPIGSQQRCWVSENTINTRYIATYTDYAARRQYIAHVRSILLGSLTVTVILTASLLAIAACWWWVRGYGA